MLSAEQMQAELSLTNSFIWEKNGFTFNTAAVFLK